MRARENRAHHAGPRDMPPVFIPRQVELWLLPSYVVVGLVVSPDLAAGLSLVVAVTGLILGYEWCTTWCTATDYRPRSAWFWAVRRNHRQRALHA